MVCRFVVRLDIRLMLLVVVIQRHKENGSADKFVNTMLSGGWSAEHAVEVAEILHRSLILTSGGCGSWKGDHGW